MPAIEELFDLHTARAAGFERYRPGGTAYVTNGLRNNGVLGYVAPLADDRVFDSMGVAVSAFCEATVQLPPFVARGNGGSGLIVLRPRSPMTAGQLAYLAAYINSAVRWRFNWYRQATVERVRRIEIPDPPDTPARFDVRSLLPDTRTAAAGTLPPLAFRPFAVDDLFVLQAGDYHSTGDLPPGRVPLVSCGDADNGITAFVDVPAERTHRGRLTIAFNGMNTLTTKYHPYRFAAKDDVAVCTPRAPMRLTTQLFVQLMMNRERWRYSYYRKCFMEKLRRQSVSLPERGGEVDEDAIAVAVESTPYWGFLKERLTA